MVKPGCSNKILITTSGNKTLARLYEGDKVVKSAEAKCAPSDTYDFKTGAELAYNRLMFGTDYHPQEVAFTPRTPETKQDNPKYKAGDKVKITKCIHGHCFDIGEIVNLEEKHKNTGMHRLAGKNGALKRKNLNPTPNPSKSQKSCTA
jgi:hypothetical protein